MINVILSTEYGLAVPTGFLCCEEEQKEVEKIRDKILRTTPQLTNLFDRYEEAETRVKEEESFDLFQEGFVLGFLFAKKIYGEIMKRSTKEGKDG